MSLLMNSHGQRYELSRPLKFEHREATNPFQQLRKELKLSQKDMSVLVGATRSQWANYEGLKVTPTLKSWLKMKKVAQENQIKLTDEMLIQAFQLDI